ncbi:type I-U CRISPR-associated protein Cas7 [Streptomyces sp. FBKL.4005]|uniref:type I-G CRISPR-associated RAMP protein Csb1/Cas7g n=1 Tax=Streptomyces sp. FBKL.4005 TaxID=2015515 RepID=UPI000B95EC55|nr:type I-U CRISPR-associated RAMP protein Csb1/Cas7u [Streptomyces sp. FBKL.4005]OYP19208.1 type I-U CRISPR-associated protein Cas7 [Streptomyces sp. FBKL.4005]
MEALYERLRAAASLQSGDGAVRVVAEYEPVGGPGAPIFPPTVKVKATDAAGYLVEPRWVDGQQTEVVLLDQRQSQANRCETALLAAIEREETFIPHLVLSTQAAGVGVRVTSLEAPHRSRDAYFRDAVNAEGHPFDKTDAGAGLQAASARDLRAYLRWVPSDLVYGVWDSHRKRRIQVKIPRAYSSEMVGVAPLAGKRAAGRMDPLNLPGEVVQVTASGWQFTDGAKKAKDKSQAKLSELGHGMIPPSEGAGGVVVKAVQRTATLSMAQLASLRFGDASPEFCEAGRALVGAIALLGDRLAFAAPVIRLRSGCDLMLVSERIEWVGRGVDGRPSTEPLALATPEQALALFEVAVARAEAAGVEWPKRPVEFQPASGLQEAIRRSFEVTGIGEAESE